MDVETISRMILDASFHPPDDNLDRIIEQDGFITDPDVIQHYGILGMRWGIRRTPEQLGHTIEKRPKGHRQGETRQEYAERMRREERERQAKRAEKSEKRQIKAQAKEQQRELRSREKREARVLKSQEKENQRKIEEARRQAEKESKKTKAAHSGKQAKVDVRGLSDEELAAAIRRLQMEKQYKDLARKPDSPAVKMAKNIATSAATQVASKYVAAYATKGIETLIKKAGGKSPITNNQKEDEKKKDKS